MVRLFGRARRDDRSVPSDESDQPESSAPLAERPERSVCTLRGTLTSVGLRSIGGVETLEAVLDDGSATITVIWLGQREIAGIHPGRELTIWGRIGRRDGERVVYNPRYELHA